YLDTQATLLYGPKANGAWPRTATSLIGPKGDTGAAGPAGPAGPSGSSGSGAVTVGAAPASGVVVDNRTSPIGQTGLYLEALSNPTGSVELLVTDSDGSLGPWSVTGQMESRSGSVYFANPSGQFATTDIPAGESALEITEPSSGGSINF